MQPFVEMGRIAGIDVGVHYTWLLIGVLIAGSFIGYLSDTHPFWPSTTIYSAGILISVLFFVSVMIHEMAHALVARAFGVLFGLGLWEFLSHKV